jgi:hypothetical protein
VVEAHQLGARGVGGEVAFRGVGVEFKKRHGTFLSHSSSSEAGGSL